MRRGRHALGGLAVVVILATVVSSGSARRITFNSTAPRIVFTDLRWETSEGASAVTCPVTLEGTFHSRTISKVSGELIGLMTAVLFRLANCLTIGIERVWILNGTEGQTNSLPWHMIYDSFVGVLPSIFDIRVGLIGFSVRILAFAGLYDCLYESSMNKPAYVLFGLEEFRNIVVFKLEENARIPKISPQMICPELSRWSSWGLPTMAGSTTKIFASLIQ